MHCGADERFLKYASCSMVQSNDVSSHIPPPSSAPSIRRVPVPTMLSLLDASSYLLLNFILIYQKKSKEKKKQSPTTTTEGY
jgi:hypothetical protein